MLTKFFWKKILKPFWELCKFTTPILFLVFNRPDTTRLVFAKIRQLKPTQLFVAADGPRKDKFGESEICREVRQIATQIDWECELKILFREENLGCGKAVSGAITWFFDHVDEGIILEDDCLPDGSFFHFCTDLLMKYRSERQVMSISGSNLLGFLLNESDQSYFWGLGGIWGWATWKRAWSLYDFEMREWGEDSVKHQISNAIHTQEWFEYYKPMFEACYQGTLDTWDVQWFYTILRNRGLSANPKVNLVKNIGFGSDATHTENPQSPIAKMNIASISLPLKHPNHRTVDVEQLNLMYHKVTSPKKYKSNILRDIFKVFFKQW
jgi:hypothetical protein